MENFEPTHTTYIIRAVDPSTTVAGEVVVTFGISSVGAIVSRRIDFANAVDAEAAWKVYARELDKDHPHRKFDSDSRRFWRIGFIRRAIRDGYCSVFGNFGMTTTHIAYEEPNQRGAGPTAGIHQSIGAMLCRTYHWCLPVVPIHSSTVKAIYGVNQFRQAGQTASELGEKERGVQWAAATYPDFKRGAICDLTDNAAAEAIADALAVAEAACRKLAAVEFGTGKPAPKKKRRTTTQKVAA